MYDIIIFGGGLSGLTLAHELVKDNFKILIVEKDNELGGMARSRIEDNSIPSEHSWRGYGPFYKNTFQLMKEIPYYDTNVFNNLSIPIEFYLLYDKIKDYKPRTTIKDKIIITYLGINYLLSGSRRDYYYTYDIEPFFKKYLSRDGYDFIINYVAGMGYGLNKREVSLGHVFHFSSIQYAHIGRHSHNHDIDQDEYEHTSDEWHVMTGPTNEVWIDPWRKELESKGVEFMNNAELIQLHYENNSIISAEVKQPDSTILLKSTDYVMATNPYNNVSIFENSNMTKLQNDFKLLTDTTKSKQISFRMALGKDISYPINNIGFMLPDSEFNITWYPQEKHWTLKPNVKSLWSGTIVDFETKGSLFNKNAEMLTEDELKAEITSQILRSNSFQKLVYDSNDFHITEDDIDFIEIWYEWKYIDGKQEQNNKKWVNNIYNEQYRMSQDTEYDNLFLAGAHTKTTINLWTMEGAIESGKITTNLILDKYSKQKVEHYQHIDPLVIIILQQIDNGLYMLNLPPLLYVMIFIAILIIYAICKTIDVKKLQKLSKKLSKKLSQIT